MISFNASWVASTGVTIFTKLHDGCEYRLIRFTHWIHKKTKAREQATEHEFNSHDAKSTSEQRWKWVIFSDP